MPRQQDQQAGFQTQSASSLDQPQNASGQYQPSGNDQAPTPTGAPLVYQPSVNGLTLPAAANTNSDAVVNAQLTHLISRDDAVHGQKNQKSKFSATRRGTVRTLWCSLTQKNHASHLETTQKHTFIQIDLWIPHDTFHQHHARSHRSEFGRVRVYALVKGTSAGLGAVSMLKDLGVDTSKNTQIDKAVLEVRVDASSGHESWQYGEEPVRFRHIATPTLWVRKLTQDGIVNVTKIRGIPNPAGLGSRQIDGESIRRALGRCHCYIREGRAGIALRAEVQEITKSHPEVFTVDSACEIDTQRKWSRNSIDHKSSDAVQLKQLRDQNPP